MAGSRHRNFRTEETTEEEEEADEDGGVAVPLTLSGRHISPIEINFKKKNVFLFKLKKVSCFKIHSVWGLNRNGQLASVLLIVNNVLVS